MVLKQQKKATTTTTTTAFTVVNHPLEGSRGPQPDNLTELTIGSLLVRIFILFAMSLTAPSRLILQPLPVSENSAQWDSRSVRMRRTWPKHIYSDPGSTLKNGISFHNTDLGDNNKTSLWELEWCKDRSFIIFPTEVIWDAVHTEMDLH